ncbi:MAG: SET domain-containing protein [Anaerolineae bacterium]
MQITTPTVSYLSPKCEVRAKGHGHNGVYSNQTIARDEVISVWGGQIMSRAQIEQLPPEIRRLSMQVEEEHYLAGASPEPADYFNHSCNPNAGLSGQIVLVALREIAPNEEICFDYATCDGTDYDEFECECGASNCRRFVRGIDWQIPELWERYHGHFMPYLQRRIDKLRTQNKG